MGPTIAEASALDELAQDDEGGGEEKVEIDDEAALLGAASELAVAIHPLVSPFYYPAASQLRALARASVAPGQVLVLVGGSSVMQGVGQGSSELWSDELQRRLGPAYVVLNYANGGNAMTDSGGVAAQMLYKDGLALIYISDLGPSVAGDPDGLRAKYVFWDAYYKGLLPDDPARMARIEELAARRGDQLQLQELKIRGLIESTFYQTDLWNWIGYNAVFTVPTQLIRLPYAWFVAPRKSYQDPVLATQPRPVSLRYPPQREQFERQIVLGMAQSACDRDANGIMSERPVPPVGTTDPDRAMMDNLPAEVRRRTVVTIIPASPHYVDLLSDDERACIRKGFERFSARLIALGYRPAPAGMTMTAGDFVDRVHLAPSGGRIVANDVSPVVRDLSIELGYLDATRARASAEEARAVAEQVQALVDAGADAPGSLGRIQAMLGTVRARNQLLEGLTDEAETAQVTASQARRAAEQFRAWIDSGGAAQEAAEQKWIEDARLQVQSQAIQARDDEVKRLLAETEAARIAAREARTQAERTRADIEAGRSGPDGMARLQAQERHLLNEDRRVLDLLKASDAARIAADQARADLNRLRDQPAERGPDPMKQLQALEQNLGEFDARVNQVLKDVERARDAAAEARTELVSVCADVNAERATRTGAPRLQAQELELRIRERALCSQSDQLPLQG